MIFALVAAVAWACTTEAFARPRIGLALSGGGARGFSHVGVLKALEALRVPVDCIAGTSAGSAIGAAYAAGLDPAEIEARLRAGDWGGGMFSDAPPRDQRPYRAKARVGGDPIGTTFGIGADGLKGSTGIFAGQQVELFLHAFLGISEELPSFDALPVPFRAITTDLVSGELVVHRSGSLVQAVRASMAVPSAFAPVKVGERLLVDGGLTQNLPVQAVREACADVVIAVNIGSPLLAADELGSVFGVALQVISILMERNVTESVAALRAGDVLIAPDLRDISAVDFTRGVDGIPAGERATLERAPDLRRLALSPADWDAWTAARRARRLPTPLVRGVQVAETRFVAPSFFSLERQTEAESPGTVDQPALQRRIVRWTAAGDFTHISYTLRPEADGHTLWIEPHEKPWGPDYLQLGFAGQVDSRGEADFSVQAVLRRTWLNARGAEWLTVFKFGATRDVETRWFQPLAPDSGWFIEPRARQMSVPWRVYAGDRALGEFRVGRRELELRGGWQGTSALVQAGLVTSRLETEPMLGLLTAPASRAAVDGLRFTLGWDRLDDLDFPRQGEALRLEVHHALAGLGADANYRRADLEAVLARSFGEDTWRARLRWARVDGETGRVRDFVGVGGFLNLSGYRPNQFAGTEVGFASLGYTRRLLPLPQPFGSGLFAGIALEAATVDQPLGDTAPSLRRFGAVTYVGAATALGPAYAGIGFAQDGRPSLVLMLGRP